MIGKKTMKEKTSKQPTLQKQLWFEKGGNEAENGKEERRLPHQKGSNIIKKGEGAEYLMRSSSPSLQNH